MDAYWHLIDPVHASILTAAAIGSFVSLLMSRNWNPVNVITALVVGLALAYYATIPIADWRGWAMGYYSALAFGIGLFGMLLLGSAMNLLSKLRDDPTGTLDWAKRLWKGDKA